MHVNIQVAVQTVKDAETDQYGKIKKNESIVEERINIVAPTLEEAKAKAVAMIGFI